MDRFVAAGHIFYAFIENTDVLSKAGYAVLDKSGGACRVAIDSGTLGDGENTLSVGGTGEQALVGDPTGRSPTDVSAQKVSVESADTYPRWDVISVDASGTVSASKGVAASPQVGTQSVRVPEERGRLQVDQPSPDDMRGWDPLETPLALLWVPGSKSSVTTADLFDVRTDPYYLDTNAVSAIETLNRTLTLGTAGLTVDGTAPLLDEAGSVAESNLGFDTATQTELNSHTSDETDPHSVTAAQAGALADAAGSVAESNLAFDPVTESETDRDSVEILIETMPQGLDPAGLSNSTGENSIEELVFLDGTQTLELWAWRCAENPAAGGATPSGLKLQMINGSDSVVYQAGGTGNGGGVRSETGDSTASTLRNGALATLAPGSATTAALRLQNDTSTDYSSSTGGVGAAFAYRVVQT